MQVDEDYGIDEDGSGPTPDDSEGVSIPRSAVQQSDEEMDELQQAVDPLYQTMATVKALKSGRSLNASMMTVFTCVAFIWRFTTIYLHLLLAFRVLL